LLSAKKGAALRRITQVVRAQQAEGVTARPAEQPVARGQEALEFLGWAAWAVEDPAAAARAAAAVGVVAVLVVAVAALAAATRLSVTA
jgi:hypothetical protein